VCADRTESTHSLTPNVPQIISVTFTCPASQAVTFSTLSYSHDGDSIQFVQQEHTRQPDANGCVTDTNQFSVSAFSFLANPKVDVELTFEADKPIVVPMSLLIGVAPPPPPPSPPVDPSDPSDPSDPVDPEPQPEPEPEPHGHHGHGHGHMRRRLLIGGIIGGVALLLLLILIVRCCKKRQARLRALQQADVPEQQLASVQVHEPLLVPPHSQSQSFYY